MNSIAFLLLEDDSLFYGESIGVAGAVSGELIFHTAMTGYQEILTDPSYAGQILVFTTPHIGNVGVNREDFESSKIWASGVVMRSYSSHVNSWRAQGDLRSLLIQQGKIAISGVDTRAITHRIRERGNLQATLGARSFSVAVVDFGVKNSILRGLEDSGCCWKRVDPTISFEKLCAMGVDGVVLSNGPGDPDAYHLDTIRQVIESGIPLLGICLGHQLLALASGARRMKMSVGHHGANHPVIDLRTKKVLISSQNHSFAVSEESLPSYLEVTHRSLFDGTIEGMRRIDKPVLGFQGHPEGGPGPHDLHCLFEEFVELMLKCQSVRN